MPNRANVPKNLRCVSWQWTAGPRKPSPPYQSPTLSARSGYVRRRLGAELGAWKPVAGQLAVPGRWRRRCGARVLTRRLSCTDLGRIADITPANNRRCPEGSRRGAPRERSVGILAGEPRLRSPARDRREGDCLSPGRATPVGGPGRDRPGRRNGNGSLLAGNINDGNVGRETVVCPRVPRRAAAGTAKNRRCAVGDHP